jgi:ferrous iron transport protein B
MSCHVPSVNTLAGSGSIALVGHPNVGKSVIFQRLTGQHAIVSNYPGTTVEVMRGAVRHWPDISLVDTPGIVTLPPHSEDEAVTERVLLNEPLKAILQVGDAKNLRRTLLLSLQLAELGKPIVLALNMMDEARQRGVLFDTAKLSQALRLPVIPTTAVRSQGIPELLQALETAEPPQLSVDYPPEIEKAIQVTLAFFEKSLPVPAPVSPRGLALLWLSRDSICQEWLVHRLDSTSMSQLIKVRDDLDHLAGGSPLATRIQTTRLAWVDNLIPRVLQQAGQRQNNLANHIGRLSTHPIWGILILVGVLLALYEFVGIFGASFLVGILEENLFGQLINPWIISLVNQWIPFPLVIDFLVGEFGLWTMGITYAFALILPIVATFFLAFGVLEDSGYLPRLAALSNRLFEKLGLNGKAVLPMVLGLGCVTMAALTTRIMESKRERILVTLLLALAVPCSAQLGVVMGMLAGVSFSAMLIWSSVVLLVMLAVGWLAGKLMPGERTQLLVELPPMRWPTFSNVFAKTLARLEWYLKEVVPLFLIGAALMFTLDQTGLLERSIRFFEPLIVGWLGLPPEASAAFLMGFLRRDFGATGLFQMQTHGLLSPIQVVVAMVTVTLFIPCIASLMVIARERGWKTASGMFLFIMPFAFLIGGLLYRLLTWIGWGI